MGKRGRKRQRQTENRCHHRITPPVVWGMDQEKKEKENFYSGPGSDLSFTLCLPPLHFFETRYRRAIHAGVSLLFLIFTVLSDSHGPQTETGQSRSPRPKPDFTVPQTETESRRTGRTTGSCPETVKFRNLTGDWTMY